MLAQAGSDKHCNIRRYSGRKLDETPQHCCRGERAAFEENGRPGADRAPGIVNDVVGKALLRFPPQGTLFTVFVVGQLEGDRRAVLPDPDQKILFVGKEPTPARLPGYLTGLRYLVKHV